jgi:hypothetical protein
LLWASSMDVVSRVRVFIREFLQGCRAPVGPVHMVCQLE